MLFASFAYIFVFLPVVVVGAVLARKLLGATLGSRVAQGWILAASIFFYTRSNPFNLIYLAISIVANWQIARWIHGSKQPARKRAMQIGLTANILYLCLFKYLGFLASIFAFALPKGFVVPSLGFPLGISFFTITQIMYLLECYEEMLTPSTLFDHATFVSFFPYLISGPLARAKRILHQFGNFGGQDGKRSQTFARGFYHFSIGLFKKAVFADAFVRVANYGHTQAQDPSAIEAWVFSIAYMMQVYFDFSGYTDMAIGSALMLGIEIPVNFDAPFRATSIIEYWQRWHISLTTFITTYLYTPILKALPKRTLGWSALATLIAMGIAGLWHGPAWTYVVWGLFHGSLLGLNQVWRKKRMPQIPKFLSWALTMGLVAISFTYFGADTLRHGNERVFGLFNLHHALGMKNLMVMNVEGVSLSIFGLPLLVGTLVSYFGPSSEQMSRQFQPTAWNCAYAVALTLVAFLFVNSNIPVPFVYFRF
jgi:alginate O-acetyltransferase complex protein AlgI